MGGLLDVVFVFLSCVLVCYVCELGNGTWMILPTRALYMIAWDPYVLAHKA